MVQRRRLYRFKVFIEYPVNLGSGCISMFSINLTFCAQVHSYYQLSVHQRAAMQQLSAKVFKLSFQYLHNYSPKSGDFLQEKIAKLHH